MSTYTVRKLGAQRPLLVLFTPAMQAIAQAEITTTAQDTAALFAEAIRAQGEEFLAPSELWLMFKISQLKRARQ